MNNLDGATATRQENSRVSCNVDEMAVQARMAISRSTGKKGPLPPQHGIPAKEAVRTESDRCQYAGTQYFCGMLLNAWSISSNVQ